MAGDGPDDQQGLDELSSNPDPHAIAEYYDAWAERYDQDVADWSYRSPAIAAQLLKREIGPDGKILDAGCGTGMTGRALRDAGLRQVEGIDISQKSLDLAAQTGAYARLTRVDMHQLPLAFEDSSFAGLQCIGVLSYLPDTEAILREFCRLVRPGGPVVITNRDDYFVERGCADIIDRMEGEGVWQKVSVSDPQPYLPENTEFAGRINVVYCVCRVL